MFPNASQPFIDLSTGINPYSYPLPRLAAATFVRLPDETMLRGLCEAAARAYGASSAEEVVPAPGTQILLPLVAKMALPGRAAVLGPTYSEHLRAATLAGHDVAEVSGLDQMSEARLAVVVNPNNPDGRILPKSLLLDLADELARLAVVVNPNNPDGRILPKSLLLDLADELARRDGILVVDEAFADVMPAEFSVADAVAARRNVVVLRSFGKFFGLAGLRLGFALTASNIACRLKAWLGPWAASGPAIHIGRIALANEEWKTATRKRLAIAAQRLDEMLVASGLDVVGGTHLYRLTQSINSAELFGRLGHCGILVRRFADHTLWLRWGLPKTENDWQRLKAALHI